MRPILLLLLVLLLLPASAVSAPRVLQPARATWDTGHFQEALVRRALTRLGYEVRPPKELENAEFYRQVADGRVDYWTNGWFPGHNSQLPPGFYKTATPIGHLVRAGGLQGYLASRDAVERFGITSLADFKREEVRKAFDRDGDGMADLVGCAPGWACNKVIEHHLRAYGLEDHVKQIAIDYPMAMRVSLLLHNQGLGILYYTWAPNWTLYRLKPGKDVLWLNVPDIRPTDAQKPRVERMTLANIPGAVTNPVKLGFVISDIRIVANRSLLDEEPPIRRLFEVMRLDIEFLSEQSTRMMEGERMTADIEAHVSEWIARNRELWEKWLAIARSEGE